MQESSILYTLLILLWSHPFIKHSFISLLTYPPGLEQTVDNASVMACLCSYGKSSGFLLAALPRTPFIHPSIILIVFPVKGHEGSGAILSCHWVKSSLHPVYHRADICRQTTIHT